MIKSVLKASLVAALGTVIFSAETLAFDLQTLSKSLGSAQLTTGHFVQERELTGFPKPMRTEGVYFLDLKKGIVWETVKPFANTMIFSEKGIKSVNKHGAQVISAQDIPYLKTVNALMLSLFSAQTERLDKDFDIHLKGSSAHWTMTLVPKKTSALATVFKTMEITGAASPESIKMVNRQNETTRLQLSKQEKDVTKELEDYRKALLRYRYEQRYINERLDTSLTKEEITEYYDSHTENFIATVPVVKACFMRISADSPNKELIKRKMSSSREEDIMEADSLAYSSADKYTDYGSKWIDMVTLARDFGTDYGSLLSVMRNSFIETSDGYGKVNVAYISAYVSAGDVLPMESQALDLDMRSSSPRTLHIFPNVSIVGFATPPSILEISHCVTPESWESCF